MGVTKRHIHSMRANQMADLAKVLSNPARVAILEYIGDCDGCLCQDIAEKIRLSQPTTSQHLQVIRKAGLLKSQFKGKAQYYSIDVRKWEQLQQHFQDFFEATKAKCC
ncbi:transcriptional regulator [Dokdonia pacifica]|uniref:Transcriptional regulator, ArsR family n=1 Tax=Dokdonia pacifica TaxID=1627892 RepID=A0A238WLV9_9FLAO|nr:metalloregulator ArsR/SmtB family transcription factor [Dokdonia pacifica]GGG22341.1 transcriptional regulator [Dokdonia pacifica]SNR47550.1 transcriptional regulator, ArsR family [Dokdonia pacifica]